MTTRIDRRTFLKGTVISSTALTLASQTSAHGQIEQTTVVPEASSSLPSGTIGKLKISRLILGGNLLTHYTHSRDLRYVYNLAAHYNTDEKIMETLALAEAHGINTVSMHNPPHPISVLRRYRKERGGKIQWIIRPTASIESDGGEYRRQVERLIEDGAEAIYLWGVFADALAVRNRFDLIAKAVDLAKEYGVPSGVGGHSLRVVQGCEEYGVKADFYIKTFHHHNYPTGPKPDEVKAPYSEFPGYWCSNPEETAEFMKSVEKPWIAFKVMAAGAIPPKDAFPYVLSNGADFVLAGMFDFEITEDAQIAREAVSKLGVRARPWRA